MPEKEEECEKDNGRTPLWCEERKIPLCLSEIETILLSMLETNLRMIFLLIKAGIFSFPWLLRPWSDGGQKFEIDPEIGRVLDKWLLRQDSGAQTNPLFMLKALEMELYVVVSISSADLVHKKL